MISDFELLTKKVGELAELAHALRRENAELRAHSAALAAENSELSRRMGAAHDRVVALLERVPDLQTAGDLPPAVATGASASHQADVLTTQQEPA